MSAAGEKAPIIAADGEVKQRKKKIPPRTSEQFTQMVNDAEAEWTAIHRFYANYNKHGVRTAPTSPNNKETAALLGMFAKLSRLYEHLEKKPKRKMKTSVKGFKQEKFVQAGAIGFFNTAGGFPDDCKILPCAAANGDGIFSIAQAISVLASYVARNNLKKNPAQKSEVTFDASLKALFAGVIGGIERKKWKQLETGEIVTVQATIQALIPKLFDTKVPVHAKLYSEDEIARMEKRSVILHKHTEENGVLRKAKNEELKVAERAEKSARKAVTPATLQATK